MIHKRSSRNQTTKCLLTVVLVILLFGPGIQAQERITIQGIVELIEFNPDGCNCAPLRIVRDDGYGDFGFGVAPQSQLEFMPFVNQHVEMTGFYAIFECTGPYGVCDDQVVIIVQSIDLLISPPVLVLEPSDSDECTQENWLNAMITTYQHIENTSTWFYQTEEQILMFTDVYQSEVAEHDTVHFEENLGRFDNGTYEITAVFNYFLDDEIPHYLTVQQEIFINSVLHSDINKDGNRNILDVVRLVGMVLGNIPYDDYDACIADCNGDDLMDILDVFCVIQWDLFLPE
ncbi:MAG: hypothetical protein H8D46_04215 [FCB group bacterium]|nr:hypothetical protein [FCB group bacterium]